LAIARNQRVTQTAKQPSAIIKATYFKLPSMEPRTPLSTNPYASNSAANPYAAPTANVAVGAEANAEEDRREHIAHEASVKAIGLLYAVSGLIVSVGLITELVMPGSSSVGRGTGLFYLLFIAVGGFQAVTGFALRKLRPWGRIAGSVFAVIGLFAFPIGTLFGICALMALSNKKSRRIFSADYQDVIAQTPHIKHRSWVVWFVLIILGVMVLSLLFGAVSSRIR
jgi:hypothetical protein